MLRRRLDELVAHDRPWRGEASLESGSGTPRPLTLRAEPVYASADRKLGYILTFDDSADPPGRRDRAPALPRQHARSPAAARATASTPRASATTARSCPP